jgi:thymidylate synthase ThyX
MVQADVDGIEVALVFDFRDQDLESISRWAQSAGSGAPEEIMTSKDPEEFLVAGLAHQSLEDIRVNFAVRGVSRVCTHQLVRTRAAAFKQQSQQDTYQGDMPEFRMPEAVWVNPVVRREWIAALIEAHRVYNLAIDADIQYKDARYILPEGTTNFILCEYSLRTFIEMYAYRACVMFQRELVHVTREMGRLLVEAHPYLEPHIKISCEKIHKCTFQGPERVEETCSFPWAMENNRTYRQKNARVRCKMSESRPTATPWSTRALWLADVNLQDDGRYATVLDKMATLDPEAQIKQAKRALQAAVRGDDEWRYPDLFPTGEDDDEPIKWEEIPEPPINMIAPTPEIRMHARVFMSGVFGEDVYTPDSIGQLVEVFIPCLRIMVERGYEPTGALWRQAGVLGIIWDVRKKFERLWFRTWTQGKRHDDSGFDLINFTGMLLRAEPNSRFGNAGEPAPPEATEATEAKS